MNVRDIEMVLTKHKMFPNMADHRIELQVAKGKLKAKIESNPRLKQFQDMEITDEMVIDVISEFFNSGGWDHLEVLKWMKKRDSKTFVGHEWDHSAARAVAQLVNDPERLKECSDWIAGL